MSPKRKWRIMVVDDDAPLLDSLVEMLQIEFEPAGARNGLDALEKLERYEPDLIILDVAMPCVDGIDTCRAIRRNARFRSVPVVFLSGHDEISFADRIKGLGAVRFLRKPITPQALLVSCRDLIAQISNATPPRKRFEITELETPGQEETEPPHVSSVAFPAAAESGKTRPLSAPQESLPYVSDTAARIMIIDDDTDVISYVLAVLRDDFEIFGVSEPVSAIYKIIRYQPDLIILDIAMPRMSGYQLSQLLRLNRNLRMIKVLFASSKDSPQEIAYARKLGAASYLVKPFSADQLLRAVVEIVEAPDFAIREKAMSFNEIRAAENGDPSPSQFL